MRRPRTRALLALAGAASLLGLVWFALPTGGPPLYDGVCVADPYAYLSPPSGASRLAPSSASHQIEVSGGAVVGSELNTDELPPQAELTTQPGSIIAPAGATSVTISIRPVAPPSVRPTNGAPDANFYLFTAVGSDGAPVTFDGSRPMTVELRPSVATGTLETIDRLDGDHWVALTTSLGGCAISMVANTPMLGMFVVVGAGQAAAPSRGSGTGATATWVIVGGGLAALALIAVALALLRRRSRTPLPQAREARLDRAPPSGAPPGLP